MVFPETETTSVMSLNYGNLFALMRVTQGTELKNCTLLEFHRIPFWADPQFLLNAYHTHTPEPHNCVKCMLDLISAQRLDVEPGNFRAVPASLEFKY